MNILLHINKYFLRFALLLLFAVGSTLCVQGQDVIRKYTLAIEYADEDMLNSESFNKNKVYIYGFVQEEDAKNALTALKTTENVDAVKYATVKKKRPDKFGDFEIKIDRNGYILIWIDDLKYKPRIISVYDFSSGSKIKIEKHEVTQSTHQNDAIGGEKEVDSDGNSVTKIQQVLEVNASFISGRRADINSSKEVNGVVTSRMDFMIPYRTTSNIRVVVQPMWFDREDFSDEDSDTVFSYGKTFYKDKVEYKFTQKRRMAFNLMNDSLYRYSMAIANQRIYDRKGSDSICSNITFTDKSDSIHVFIVDTVSGFDPDYSHPYPFGAVVNVYDYNAKVYSLEKKGNGERKVPLKFLDFTFREYLPNPTDFAEKLDAEPQETNDVVKLNFENGKDVIINDSTNAHELNKTIEYVQKLSDTEKYELKVINVTGVASPEGGIESNKSLAKRRANFLVNKLKAYTTRPINTDESDVATWETVADTLEQAGYPDKAADIRAICEKFPGKMNEQYAKIAQLPYYSTFLKDSILPKLRTVRYLAKFEEIRQLSTEEVIEKYYKDKNYKFSRGEFWSLFNNLEDPRERERVARHALKVTKKTDAQYNEGYWAYAACLLACQYIARDTADFNVLKPFLDFNLKTVEYDTIKAGSLMPRFTKIVAKNDTIIEREDEYNLFLGDTIMVEDRTISGRNIIQIVEKPIPNKKYRQIKATKDTLLKVLKKDTIKAGNEFKAVDYIVSERDTIVKVSEKIRTKIYKKHEETQGFEQYTNYPEVAANQLIMALRQKNRSRNKEIPILEAITADGGAKYDTLLYFSKCLRGGYQAGDEFSELEAAKVRSVVSSTSVTNSVIIKLAMEDEANLNQAVSAAKNLPDNAVSDYLKAIINLRKKNRQEASRLLALSFVRDIKMIPIASNDEDFIRPDDTEFNNVVGAAIKLWQDTMRTIVTVKKAPVVPVQTDSVAQDSISVDSLASVNAQTETIAGEMEETPEYNEKHPFTWYIRAIEMLSDKDVANDDAAKEALFRCFDMDKRYIPIINVSMIKDNNIRNKKELKAKLKAFRNEYNLSK